MKNEKLIQAARKSRETQYEAPCLANGAAHSEDYSRRVERLIKKADKSRLSFLFTSGAARVAAAALALVIVAAAVFAVPAVRRSFSAKVEDNVLYRSENGDVVVRAVEPLGKPVYHEFIWAPITEEKLKNQAEVFIGTIEKVEEVEVSYVYDGVPCTNYYSLLTVRANDIIKGSGSISEGTITKTLFPLSTRRINEDGIYPQEGKEYAFFLQKTIDGIDILDLTPVADYYYQIAAYVFIPLDEEQHKKILTLIGAEEGICGEEFVEALRNYYK